MSKQNVMKSLFWTVVLLGLTSCATPNYLPLPAVAFPAIQNTASFGIQNLDEKAKIENNVLTCHYEGFDVKYVVRYDFVISFVIINKSNKSLIIDKSKSYVLYDGYSSQLFKDVRSSRSTTFNNVQDAINNVQTNESGVSMSIPPYSKWELPLQEANIRAIKTNSLPSFRNEIGIHSLTPYDNKETVEFVIPYSYDYSMTKWDTSRNRIYINSIEAVSKDINIRVAQAPSMINSSQYTEIRPVGEPDLTEVNRVYAINLERYRQHNKKVHASNIFWGIITLPTIIGPVFCWGTAWNCESHLPPVSNGSVWFDFQTNKGTQVIQ